MNNSSGVEHSIFDEDEKEEADGITIVIMEVRRPLTFLRQILQKNTSLDLSKYTFTLQDSQVLDEDSNLADCCVEGVKLVQINLKVLEDTQTINILDVLKPSDDFFEVIKEQLSDLEEDDPLLTQQWSSCLSFQEKLQLLNIPTDPCDWEIPHVRHWILWAVREFNLVDIKLDDWLISGVQLISLSKEEFQSKVPKDPGDLFWKHFLILCKHRIVAILNGNNVDIRHGEEENEVNVDITVFEEVESVLHDDEYNCLEPSVSLWQFLLELLTDRNHRECIQWLDIEGEFRIVNPHLLANLWGNKKNNKNMSYDKLSRALRFYYQSNIIEKVPQKKFVYKFVCDLKILLGYSSLEIKKILDNL